MSLWVAKIIMLAYDSGLVFDANEASENARNRKSFMAIGFILMVTPWCFLAAWKVLLAIVRVFTFAIIRVFTAMC